MGAFHRRVEISTRETDPGLVEGRAVVEDDFHHFRVEVCARDGRVTQTFSEAVRSPNTLCPGAGSRLAELIGMPLNESSAAVMQFTDARQQCTHQIDLAGLAVAALARRRQHRLYEATIPDRIERCTTATLRRDGEVALNWELTGTTITAPVPYAGHGIGSGFAGFTRSLPLEEAEAALVLRRAVFVSQGRSIDLDKLPDNFGPVGGCWAWQPERMGALKRLPDSRRDFTGHAHVLTLDDQRWLRFED